MRDPLYAEAARTIAAGSKSFAAAARLFPAAMRRDVTLLYAWCRHCDDVIDGQTLGHGTLHTATFAMLKQLREDSRAAARGHPGQELGFRALAEVCCRHALDLWMIEAHVDGFELDVSGWSPLTLDDTLRYCYHVAGVVGIMMARIMGVEDRPENRATLARACDLGIAFQLTNIARDVVEDARGGRCYLPAEWLEEAGLRVADLVDPAQHQRAFPVVRRLVDRAEPYYASARIGIRALPRRAAWAIATALAVYRDIGRCLCRRGPRGLAARIRTGRATKLGRIVTASPALWSAARDRVAARDPGLWTPSALQVSNR